MNGQADILQHEGVVGYGLPVDLHLHHGDLSEQTIYAIGKWEIYGDHYGDGLPTPQFLQRLALTGRDDGFLPDADDSNTRGYAVQVVRVVQTSAAPGGRWVVIKNSWGW